MALLVRPRAWLCPAHESQARGATVHQVRTVASIGCAATAQAARLYAFEAAGVQKEDYIITADADALICSKDVLMPDQLTPYGPLVQDGKPVAVWRWEVRLVS